MKSGGAENIYSEIWGGAWPSGPPGSSAYGLAAAIGLALNVTVTEFVDTVCSRHILACMTPSYILESFHVRKTIQRKISRMSNNGKAKIFYHEIMVVWHNTVLQCGKKMGMAN